jgi:hypothetical protein
VVAMLPLSTMHMTGFRTIKRGFSFRIDSQRAR